MLSSHSREALKKVSAATLTTVLFKRGFRNAFIQNVFLLNKKAPRMVGGGGGPVEPGDVVVGDAEGVVVIPAKIADEVAAEAAKQTEFEDWVEAKVKEGRSIFGLYTPDEKTRAEFEAWKKKAK